MNSNLTKSPGRAWTGATLAALILTGSLATVNTACSGGFARKSSESRPADSGDVSRRAAGESRASRGRRAVPTTEKKKNSPSTKRLLVYRGNLSLRVAGTGRAINEATVIVKKLRGYVQSTRSYSGGRRARVVLRVPVRSFHKAMEQLGELGKVTARRVSAQDVTRRFLDTRARLDFARKTRERLYVLLRRVKKVKERIRILKEINRLTSLIETLGARAAYLRKQADFSTIVLDLRVRRAENLARFLPSPFPWLRRLGPKRTITRVGFFQMKRPSRFFDFQSDFQAGKKNYLYVSPDGAQLRVGVVPNEPRANASFWAAALKRELVQRGFVLQEHSKPGGGEKQYFRFKSGERIYSVVLTVLGDWIHVVEAVYPDQKSFRANEAAVRKALANYKPETPSFLRRVMAVFQ